MSGITRPRIPWVETPADLRRACLWAAEPPECVREPLPPVPVGLSTRRAPDVIRHLRGEFAGANSGALSSRMAATGLTAILCARWLKEIGARMFAPCAP